MYVVNWLEDAMALDEVQIRAQLREEESKLHEANKRREDATAECRQLDKRCQALRVLLEEEDSDHGKQASVASQPEAVQLLGVSDNGRELNKTAAIRSILRTAGSRGVTAVQIWRDIEAQSIKMPRNYVYAVLSRLVDNGSVQRNGDVYSEKGR
jgi:hypothetical protein